MDNIIQELKVFESSLKEHKNLVALKNAQIQKLEEENQILKTSHINANTYVKELESKCRQLESDYSQLTRVSRVVAVQNEFEKLKREYNSLKASNKERPALDIVKSILKNLDINSNHIKFKIPLQASSIIHLYIQNQLVNISVESASKQFLYGFYKKGDEIIGPYYDQQAPVEGAEAPAEEPQAPAETPQVSAEAPAEEPQAQAETPQVSAEAPAEEPQAPAETPQVSAQAPVETTQAPVETTQVSVEAPAEAPQAPAETPQATAEESQEPQVSAEAPAEAPQATVKKPTKKRHKKTETPKLSEKKIKDKIYYVDNSTTPKKVYNKNTDESCGDYVGYIEKVDNKSKMVWMHCTLDS